jgi:hypothetical protein
VIRRRGVRPCCASPISRPVTNQLTLAQRLSTVRVMCDALRTVAAVRIALSTRRELLLESLALRHQLGVLARSNRRFRASDRLLWLLLRRLWPCRWRIGSPATKSLKRTRHCDESVRPQTVWSPGCSQGPGHTRGVQNPMRRIASLLRFLIDLHVVGFRRASLEGDRHLFAVF